MSPFDLSGTLDAEGQDTGQSPLSLRNLTVSYGAAPVVIAADMTLVPGSMTAIVGPNGAGKSTLLKAALGLVPALAGEVRFWGAPLAQARDRVAYVPQRAAIDWEFPARVIDVVMMGLYRQLGLLARVRGQHRRAAMDCLERVGLSAYADRQIGRLSGGQQQRVFLARALAQQADLVVLDEPFAGVDAATEAALIDVLHGLKSGGATILAVHHDLSTVEAYFDRVFLINRRPLAEGPVPTTFTRANLDMAYGTGAALRAG